MLALDCLPLDFFEEREKYTSILLEPWLFPISWHRQLNLILTNAVSSISLLPLNFLIK